jgi:hypothetical protein
MGRRLDTSRLGRDGEGCVHRAEKREEDKSRRALWETDSGLTILLNLVADMTVGDKSMCMCITSSFNSLKNFQTIGK